MIWFPRAAVETANVAWWAIEFARLGRLPDERDDASGMLPVLQQLDLFLLFHPECNLIAVSPQLARALGPALLPPHLAYPHP